MIDLGKMVAIQKLLDSKIILNASSNVTQVGHLNFRYASWAIALF
jgi:hypothetical protein